MYVQSILLNFIIFVQNMHSLSLYTYIYIYMNNISFLKHCCMFPCLYIILKESHVAKDTKLVKWKPLYK